MDQLKPLISKDEIAQKIKQLSAQIEIDYKGKDLVILMVLKGAICFVADLIRQIDLPIDLQTVQCSSYGARGSTRGELTVHGIERLQIHNRDCLVVDDIFDSGHTMTVLLKELEKQKPRTLQSCVLLYKNKVQKVTDYRPNYILFPIQNEFVVGYGLDYKEQYRGLPDINILVTS